MIVATCALQGAAFAAATEVIDVSGFGASRTVNELIFVQVAGGGSAGSGNINPFVRIQQSPGEQGYNMSASAEFDEKGGSFNPNLQIVQFVLPSGYSFTIPNVSNAEDIDSDGDTVTGNAMLITVVEGSEGGAGAGDLVGQVDPIVVNLGGFDRRIDAGLTCPVVIECPWTYRWSVLTAWIARRSQPVNPPPWVAATLFGWTSTILKFPIAATPVRSQVSGLPRMRATDAVPMRQRILISDSSRNPRLCLL